MEQETNQSIDLDAFFSLNLDLLCVAGLDGTFAKLNKSWSETIGYDIEYMEGKQFIDFVHPEDREITIETMSALKEGKPVLNFVNRYKHKNGLYRYIEWRSVPKDGYIYAAARDVTERIRNEEEILKLSKAVEFNPATVLITDANGNISYVNNRFQKLTGYSREEVLGRNPRIFKSGRQDREFYSRLWETISSGKSWSGEFYNKKKNGELYWESALISPIFNERGNITHYVAVKEDITARKEAEERLEESMELLDLFFRQSLDGFFFMMLDEPMLWGGGEDKDSVLEYAFDHQRITKINKAMLEQYIAEEKDFMGLTPRDFFQHNIEYGKKVWRQFFDDGKLHIDTREQKFDGTSMIIEGDYICMYDSRGRITGHFGIQREVTFEREALGKLEESEERFRQLAENIDQVFFLRTETEMLYVSPAYENIWGMPLQSLYENPDSFLDTVHPEDKVEVTDKYENCLDSFNFEYRIVRPDGGVRWILAKTFIVKTGKEADAVRVAGIAQDITERKELEEKLREVSIRDPLTGLYNRRYMFDRLEPLFERSKRDGELFSIAMLDIDHFKGVNDTYGHLAGDLILKRFAEILTENIRAYDVLGRFGGEEFLIVYIGVGRESAKELAERILSAVREETVHFEGNDITFTFSCGISDSGKCASPGCSLETMIGEADGNLYEAKRSGRNRVLS
jgi:diguanylate cyclase (GGDEF)-like protein/PAS domain S-box-containing protein